MTKRSLFSFTLEELRSHLTALNFSKFSADQIFRWIYKDNILNIDQWSNISKKLREYLSNNITIELPTITFDILSKDGTRKFLIQFNDGETVEAVAIPAKDNRLTFCLSSQIGCCIGCTFCNTATQGLTRHLKSEEIVGQLITINNWLQKNVDSNMKATNIVFMGQGEPLHNFNNVKTSIEIFLENKGLMIGQRKITLSTSGLVPQIEKLNDFPPVNIAISLHAAHDNIRSELMPINDTYNLKRLFEAIKKIKLKAHRSITYEYLLIKDFNDRSVDIDALTKLIDKKTSKINIIPFNNYPGSKFSRPSGEKMLWFKNKLLNLGYVCTIRLSKGSDIMAACGQLKSEQESLNTKHISD